MVLDSPVPCSPANNEAEMVGSRDQCCRFEAVAVCGYNATASNHATVLHAESIGSYKEDTPSPARASSYTTTCWLWQGPARSPAPFHQRDGQECALSF